MSREDEGSDLWEWETPRGLFLGSQKVLRNVWVDVWVEISRSCGWINACGWNAGMPGSDWVLRSHRDYSALVRDPKVFFDRGRSMPEGSPLLKERRYLRKDAAEHLWKSLQTQGWKKTRPLWGRLLNPEPVYLLMLLCCSLG